MKDIDFVLLLSRWLHLAAAMTAVGGAVFMRFALLPAASESLDEPTHVRVREAVRRRWMRIVHAAIAVLLLTGGFNFVMLALPPRIPAMPYHAFFGVKFMLALAMFFIAIALTGRSPAFAPLRQSARRWLSILLVLAAVIVLVSGVLNQVRSGQERRQTTVAAVSS